VLGGALWAAAGVVLYPGIAHAAQRPVVDTGVGAASPTGAETALRPILGFNCHEPTNTALLDTAAAAGFGWMRTDLKWATVQSAYPFWNISKNGNVEATIGLDTEVKHSGTASLKLTNATPRSANRYATVLQTVEVEPATQYSFSAWVKGESVSRASIALNSQWTQRFQIPSGTYDWTLLQWTVTTAADQTSFGLRMISEDITAGLWLDDVVMTRAGSSTNLIINPGFDMVLDYNWSSYDEAVALCDERDLKVLFILDYGNELFGGLPTNDDTVAAYVAFAAAAAEYFQGTGARFEIWNEPHNFGPLTAPEFARIVREASAAIHAVDPSATVVSGGLGKFLYDYQAEMVGAGLGDVDAIGIHSYWMSTWNERDLNDAPEAIFYHLDNWRTGFPAGHTKADQMTEMGPRLGDDAGGDHHTYATLIIRTILTHWMAGFTFINLYDATDGAFGLFRTDDAGQTRRAVAAITALTALATDRSLAGYHLPTPDRDFYGLALEPQQPGRTLAVEAVWVESGSDPQSVPVPPGATVTDMYGNVVDVGSHRQDSTLTLTPDAGVHYITYPRSRAIPRGQEWRVTDSIDNSSGRIVYQGAWTTVSEPGAHQGEVSVAEAVGASVTVSVTGRRVMIFGPRGREYGIARVIVDGGEPQLVDLWHNNHLDQALLFDTGYLSDCGHTVEVSVTGDQRETGEGTLFGLDKIIVLS
jgi:hypothetical protein